MKKLRAALAALPQERDVVYAMAQLDEVLKLAEITYDSAALACQLGGNARKRWEQHLGIYES